MENNDTPQGEPTNQAQTNSPPPVAAQPQAQPEAVQPAQPVAVQPLPTQPVAPQPAPVQQAYVPPSQSGSSGAKKPLKGILVSALVAILVLAGGGGYYAFGYLPNTPENVWRRGLASIGVGLEELTKEQELFTAEAVEFDGEFNLTRPTELSIKMDGTTGLVSSTGEFSLGAEWEQYSPQLDMYYSLMDANPQLFFRFDGLKEIVDDNVGAGVFDEIAGGNTLEGIWWLLDFEELVERGLLSQSDLDELLQESSLDEQVTTEDYQKITQSIIDASQEYMFTANVEDMVLQIEEELGTEEFEGVESRKYAVSVNKDNLKKYVVAVRDNLIASGALDKLFPELDLAEELSTSDIDEAVDEIDFSDVKIEAWVGLNNKVLRNLRFTPTNEEGYLEMSLLLEGDNLDRIPMKMKIVLDDDTATGSFEMGLVTDLKENSAEMTMNMDITDNGSFDGTDFKMDARISFKDLAKEPKFETPTPSESFLELLDELGGANSVLGITSDELGL